MNQYPVSGQIMIYLIAGGMFIFMYFLSAIVIRACKAIHKYIVNKESDFWP